MLKIVVLLIIFVEPNFFFKGFFNELKKNIHIPVYIYIIFFTVVQQFTHNIQKLL